MNKIIASIIDKKYPLVANLANISACLNMELKDINWVGFYLVEKDGLYLGPFQGEVACTMIPFDKGVCGYAYRNKKTVIVDDVNKFDGHIACSTLSKSEIVTPIIKNGEVKAVIDIDSPIFNRFTKDDQELLEELANILKELF